MKKLITLLFVLQVVLLNGQEPCEEIYLNFEDNYCLDHLLIDTSQTDNIWQIGKPQKPGFNVAHTAPNVIITDTVNPYPPDNYSAFTIWGIIDEGYYFGLKMFGGTYNVQSDSLNDFGMMEFSADEGITWIDMINDTAYMGTFIWFNEKPVLRGISSELKFFEVSLADIASTFNLQIGDTVLYRFSFQSDATADTLAGLMYDSFAFGSWVEGISETRFKTIKSTIYPNPSTDDKLVIDFANPESASFQLSVYDINSNLILSEANIVSNKIVLDASLLKPGTYIYKLTNLEAKQRSWGKFIIQQ